MWSLNISLFSFAGSGERGPTREELFTFSIALMKESPETNCTESNANELFHYGMDTAGEPIVNSSEHHVQAKGKHTDTTCSSVVSNSDFRANAVVLGLLVLRLSLSCIYCAGSSFVM